VGFKTLIKPDIVLNVQDALSINFTLPVGALYETMTVEAGAPLGESPRLWDPPWGAVFCRVTCTLRVLALPQKTTSALPKDISPQSDFGERPSSPR
jgi:hypothetical protein